MSPVSPQGTEPEHSMCFESKWPDPSSSQSSETHALATSSVQDASGQTNAWSCQVSESWSCAKSHRAATKYDVWMYDILGVVGSGSRRAAQGDRAGDNWLKWHRMENAVTRRGEYNQEIFWISGIMILQGSHNYCICIGHNRTLCQKERGKIFHPVLRRSPKWLSVSFNPGSPVPASWVCLRSPRKWTMKQERKNCLNPNPKLFCAIFSFVTYISDQVTRNTLPLLSEPDQRSGVHKHPEDMQTQRQATGSPKVREIQGQTGKWRHPLPTAGFGEVPFPATIYKNSLL